jgi:hypothetical protein
MPEFVRQYPVAAIAVKPPDQFDLVKYSKESGSVRSLVDDKFEPVETSLADRQKIALVSAYENPHYPPVKHFEVPQRLSRSRRFSVGRSVEDMYSAWLTPANLPLVKAAKALREVFEGVGAKLPQVLQTDVEIAVPQVILPDAIIKILEEKVDEIAQMDDIVIPPTDRAGYPRMSILQFSRKNERVLFVSGRGRESFDDSGDA